MSRDSLKFCSFDDRQERTRPFSVAEFFARGIEDGSSFDVLVDLTLVKALAMPNGREIVNPATLWIKGPS